MKRTTYIKRNSHTQAVARNMHQVVTQVCKAAGITADQWLELMFETGCQVAEKNEPNEAVRRYLLQDETFGFWAWWIDVYVAHDNYLLTQPTFNYQLHKHNMPAIMCLPEHSLSTNIITAK